jgi:hypothetical protein
MPRTVTEVDVLQDYIRGVMDRAAHHAGNVDEICLAIAGAIIWRKDGDIQVYEREGQMTNALWVSMNSARYALSYNHDAGQIEIREDSMRGRVVASFDNTNTAAEVRRFFASL